MYSCMYYGKDRTKQTYKAQSWGTGVKLWNYHFWGDTSHKPLISQYRAGERYPFRKPQLYSSVQRFDADHDVTDGRTDKIVWSFVKIC